MYCSFTQLFVIFIAFGQLDLLLFRLGSDLLANYVTLSIYLDGKIHDPEMHAKTSTPHHGVTPEEEDQKNGSGVEAEGGDSRLMMTEIETSLHQGEMIDDFKPSSEQENARLLKAPSSARI